MAIHGADGAIEAGLDPHGREALAKGVALYKAGQLDEAAAQLELAGTRSAPGSAERRRYFIHMFQLLALRHGDPGQALALCRQAIDQWPADLEIQFLAGRVLAKHGRHVEALGALRRAWRTGRDRRIAYELAKIFDARGRRRLAVEYGELAHELGVRSDYLMSILGRNLYLLGQFERSLHFISTIESSESASNLKTWKDLAESGERTRAFRRAHPELPIARHIAIVGETYVGSTLFGLILGSLPGVAFVGESQALTHRWDVASQANLAIDFAVDAPRQFNHCRTHGPTCENFDVEFRADLLSEPVDTYAKIARRLGTRVLVTSDKAVTRLRTIDPMLAFDLVILYKAPEPWIRSYARQRSRAVSNGLLAAESAGDLSRWLEQWCNTYEGLLRLPMPLARRAVLDWEQFVAAPQAHFEHLLARFALAGDSSVFSDLDIGCFIGGNQTGNLQEVQRSHSVTFKPSSAPPLPEEMQRELRSHQRSSDLATRLDRLYRADFAGCALQPA
jgi:hypothetical protein